jgi:hypothetical protein
VEYNGIVEWDWENFPMDESVLVQYKSWKERSCQHHWQPFLFSHDYLVLYNLEKRGFVIVRASNTTIQGNQFVFPEDKVIAMIPESLK